MRGEIQKGGLDRGPKKTTSNISERKSELMDAATTDVIHAHPSMSIKDSAKRMLENDVRRLPVIDAGTHRLIGLVTGIDVLDFLGGGPKYNIFEQDFNGNFLAAINCPLSKIMRPIQYLVKDASFEDAADIMVNRRSSIIPLVENEESLKVIGVLTERNLMPAAEEFGVSVGEIMSKKLITATDGMMLSDVSKIMVRNQLRRLPVITAEKLNGLVTVFDALRFLKDGHYKGVDVEKNLSTRVSELISHDVVSVDAKDDVGRAVRLMDETGYGGFPVLDDGNLVGIITTTDILSLAWSD